MQIRHYREGDERGITDLMSKVFGIRMTEELWRWKFFGSSNDHPVIVVCEDRGRIIGHSALVPRRVVIQGGVVPALSGVDAMVDPEYRGKGIFLKIQDEVNRTAAGREAKFVFSFANASSRRILEDRNIRKHVGEIESSTRVIRPIRFAINRLRKKLSKGPVIAGLGSVFEFPPFAETLEGGLTALNVSRFRGELDDLWHSTCSVPGIMVERSDEYLNWRYIDHPARSYLPLIVKREGKTTGFVVLGTLDVPFRKGVIMDCHFSDDDREAIATIGEHILLYFRRAGLESVTSWTPGGTILASVLKSLGFLERRAEVFLLVKAADSELESALCRMKDWYYSYGDSDIA